MDDQQLNELAPKQLERVLGFFARVESKASFLFGVNTALIGALALNVQKTDLCRWPNVTAAVLAAASIAASFYFVFKSFFPNLRGGHSSLIYFKQIAGLREQEYVSRFKAQTVEQHRDDVLAQTWRNAEILTEKFDAIKTAFFLSAFSLAPWTLFLILASIAHAQLPTFK